MGEGIIMPQLTVLVGPPAAGKSKYAHGLIYEDGDHGADNVYVNQDKHGKQGHMDVFNISLVARQSIIIDRMGFSKEQRQRYIKPAKEAGYTTKIVVLHENKETCIKRGKLRLEKEYHETIKTEQDLRKAINFFFSNYERPTLDEADEVEFRYPKQSMVLHGVICDIDGTMSDPEHRLHFVRGEGRKDWKNFLLPQNVEQDGLNKWCRTITNSLRANHIIIMCSGRTDSLEKTTREWLEKHKVQFDHLFMRPRDDHRQDYIIKEIILDFEILTRVQPFFAIDDRKQVVDLWRRRGITALACSDGDF